MTLTLLFFNKIFYNNNNFNLVQKTICLLTLKIKQKINK